MNKIIATRRSMITIKVRTLFMAKATSWWNTFSVWL